MPQAGLGLMTSYGEGSFPAAPPLMYRLGTANDVCFRSLRQAVHGRCGWHRNREAVRQKRYRFVITKAEVVDDVKASAKSRFHRAQDIDPATENILTGVITRLSD